MWNIYVIELTGALAPFRYLVIKIMLGINENFHTMKIYQYETTMMVSFFMAKLDKMRAIFKILAFVLGPIL